MNTNDLKQYLKYVLETEKNVYTLSQSASKMYNYMQSLGRPQNFAPKIVERNVGDRISLTLINIFCSSLIWGIYGVGIGILFSIFSFSLKIFIPALLLCIVIGAVVGFFKAFSVIKGVDNANKSELQQYSVNLKNDKSRVNSELVKKQNTTPFYHSTQNQLQSTKQMLDKLYRLNIIHPQYRNIIAVASFYQYFDTGRCTELEGHEGAYNLYEAERRQNMIISQLNTVISQLESIRYNQGVLYNAMVEASRSIDRLTDISEMTRMQSQANAANSAIIAHNTKVAAQDVNTLKWIEFLKM